ncbi:MAG: fatty acid desaturase, partial [Paracoccus sp. (in: a-proteobacteria)]|nr:fatty acid desaturase [Paracoccus sp. (in: a-proteobacteria)]
SDYVQHYGLGRRVRDGRVEPVGPRHSWDAPHPFSSLAMVNAPRHSDHHAHPARPYPALRLDAGTRPMLPFSLPVMGAMALLPPVWRRVMDRRVMRMQALSEEGEEGDATS